MKICIFGNSVGLKMRPERTGKGQKTYGEILENRGHFVRNVCKAGVMINEVFAFLDDEVLCFFPDVVIINFGIVEVCQRNTIRALNNSTILNYYRNTIFRRSYSFQSGLVQCILKALKKIQTILASLLHLRWQWFDENKFIEVLTDSIKIIQRETAAHVIILGCSPCDDRVSRLLPGSNEAIQSVNDRMSQIAHSSSGHIQFIDPAIFLHQKKLAELVPDGIHFSSEGHRLVAEKIASLLPK